MIGVVVMILGWSFQEMRSGFTIIGAIITACGVGTLVSCVASYGLSKNFGLLNGGEDRRS